MTIAATSTATAPLRVGGRRRGVTVAVVVAVGLGVLLGVLWWVGAPLARGDVVNGQVFLTGHPELEVAQDGWFAGVTGLAGVLAATVVSLRHGRGDAASAVLVPLLGLGAAVVAWQTGALLGPGPLATQVADGSAHPLTPLQLHAYGALLVGPVLFTLTRFLAALFSAEPAAGPSAHGS